MNGRYFHICSFMVAMVLVLSAYSQEHKETSYNRQIYEKTRLADVYKLSINLSCENNVVDFSFNISANGDTETVIVLPYKNQFTPYSNLAKTFNEKSAGQGCFDITDKIFYSVDFCIDGCLSGRIYRCIVSCPATTTTPTTESIAGNPSTSNSLIKATTTSPPKPYYFQWIILALVAVLLLAVGAVFFFSKRAKICLTKPKKNSVDVEPNQEQNNVGQLQPNNDLLNKSTNLQIKLEQQIKLFIAFSNDHTMHQDVIINFVKFLQADLGFEVYCELFSDQDISLDPAGWLENRLCSADKALILWSPGGVQKWNNETDNRHVNTDLFTPVLRRLKNDIFHNINAGKYCFGYFDYCTKESIPEVFGEARAGLYHYKLMEHFDDLYYRLKGIERYLPDGQIAVQNVDVDLYHDPKINKYGNALRKSIEMMNKYVQTHPEWYLEDTATSSLDKAFLKPGLCHEYEIAKLHLTIAPPLPLKSCSEIIQTEDQYKAINEESSKVSHQLNNIKKDVIEHEATNFENKTCVLASTSSQHLRLKKVPVGSSVSNSLQDNSEISSTGSHVSLSVSRQCEHDSGYATVQNSDVTGEVQHQSQGKYKTENINDQRHSHSIKHPQSTEKLSNNDAGRSNDILHNEGGIQNARYKPSSTDKPKLQLAPMNNDTEPMTILMSINFLSMTK